MEARTREWNAKYKDPMVQYLRSALTSRAGIVFQARCCRLLEAGLPEFITAEEAGATDAGLLVEKPPPSWGQNPSLRVRDALRLYSKEKVILPLDFKFITPNLLTRDGHKSQWYEYRFGIMPDQANVAAFIVGSPLDPGKVAVIPHAHISPQYPNRKIKGRAHYASHKVSVLNRYTSPFPPEWAPFIIPLSELPAALKKLLDYARGHATIWENPHNGIDFDCPIPALQSIHTLIPHRDSVNYGEAEFIEHLREAFLNVDSAYQLDRLLIRPSIGDFQLVHVNGNSEIKHRVSVELKLDGAQILSDGSLLFKDDFESIDCMSIADFYLLILQWTNRSDAVLLANHELPDSWKSAPPGVHAKVISDADLIASRTVKGLNEQKPVAAIKMIERVVSQHAGTNTHRAPSFALLPRHSQLLKNIATAPTSHISSKRSGKSSRPAPRTEGFSQQLHQAREAALLNDYCHQRDIGAFYHLGHHPSAEYIFSPIKAATFFDLPLYAPLVYVNFATVNIMDQLLPSDSRKPKFFYHATHGQTKSFYILCPCPYRDDPYLQTKPPQHRYVVPSETIKTQERTTINESILQDPAKVRNEGERQLILGEMMDSYSVQFELIVDTLLGVFEGHPEEGFHFVGNEALQHGINIAREDYLTNWLEVAQEFMDCTAGRSFWTTSRPWARKGLSAGDEEAEAEQDDGDLGDVEAPA